MSEQIMEDRTMLQILTGQSKPIRERQIKYMCRLCGRYDIDLRKAHLVNDHGADPKRMAKRATKGLLYEIFGEAVRS